MSLSASSSSTTLQPGEPSAGQGALKQELASGSGEPAPSSHLNALDTVQADSDIIKNPSFYPPTTLVSGDYKEDLLRVGKSRRSSQTT